MELNDSTLAALGESLGQDQRTWALSSTIGMSKMPAGWNCRDEVAKALSRVCEKRYHALGLGAGCRCSDDKMFRRYIRVSETEIYGHFVQKFMEDFHVNRQPPGDSALRVLTGRLERPAQFLILSNAAFQNVSERQFR